MELPDELPDEAGESTTKPGLIAPPLPLPGIPSPSIPTDSFAVKYDAVTVPSISDAIDPIDVGKVAGMIKPFTIAKVCSSPIEITSPCATSRVAVKESEHKGFVQKLRVLVKIPVFGPVSVRSKNIPNLSELDIANAPFPAPKFATNVSTIVGSQFPIPSFSKQRSSIETVAVSVTKNSAKP